MAKKVTAPKTYDPGKGRPKEHLAYLNEREMAYLRSINGNNMERGPRNLPSFPPNDAIGSSSRTSPSGGGYNSGTKGSKGGGASTQSPGAGASSGRGAGTVSGGQLGGGGKGGTTASRTSPSSPTTGAGGQRGAGSNYGPGSARPGTVSGVGGAGPSSPMSGQGQSFRSPMGAGWANRDVIDKQRTELNNARNTLQSTRALKTDLQVGGIRSLNVGPIGTTVNVPKVSAPISSVAVNPAKTSIAASIRQASFTPTGYYNTSAVLSDEDINRRVAAMNAIQNAALPEPNVPNKIDVNDVYGPVQERVLAVEDVPPEKPTYEDNYGPQKYLNVSGGLGISAYNATPQAQRLSTTSPTTSLSGRGKSTATLNSLYNSQSPVKTRGIENAVNTAAVNRGIESTGEILSEDGYGYPKKADGSPITAEDIANMPPSVQKEYYDKVRYSREYDTPYPLTSAQKTKGYIASGIGAILNKGLLGAGMRVASLVPGEFGKAAKKISNPRAAVNEYDRANPLRQQQIKERAGRKAGFGEGTTTTSAGGGTPDIGSGGKNEPDRIKPEDNTASKKANTPSSGIKKGGRRPAIYYKWDLGVEVPSPTDSGYPLYLKYLEERAAAKAAV